MLILSGANNHDWKTTTPALKKIYEDSGRFVVDVTENVPSLTGADLGKYDVLVCNYTSYPQIEGHRWLAATEKAFLDYIAAGHGFVAFHAASSAWCDWPEFGDLIGLTWQMDKITGNKISGHGKKHSFAVNITDTHHPVTAGMKDFQHVTDELYHRQLLHPAGHVLATAFSSEAMHGSGTNEPMVVVTERGKGRGFYCALGHKAAAMEDVGFQTLMLRGAEWAATGKVTIPVPAVWPAPGSPPANEDPAKVGISKDATTSLHAAPRLNVLFFTADDMNFDSSGVCGGPVKDLTPNLDRLAAEGLRFQYAYSTVAVCQPVRQIMQTGLYPHRNGAMGFFPIKAEVRTLNQQLHDAGYLISMFGKIRHHQPAEKFCADVADDTISRRPSKLAEATRKFLRTAREQNRPFFHNVNCYDPHRPFIGINGRDDLAEGEPPSRWIKPEEVTAVPGFLEDLPDIRRELAGYYTNVRRLDDALGAVLAVLKEEGFADNTLVMFYGGDHGMSFPFAKSNDYENSSRGALMIRWPGVTKPGSVDRDHLVSTLDFAPTLLAALSLPPLAGIDGRSFLPAVKGEAMTGWDCVFTFYNAAFGNRWLPMRCVRTKDRAYIWNAWSDGKREYHTENMAGLSWKAMLAAAATHPDIKARTDFYLYRVPEEFYDLTYDRCERANLIGDPARQAEIEALRRDLLALMRRTGDPFTEAFVHRDQKDLIPAVLKQLNEEYGPAPQPRKED